MLTGNAHLVLGRGELYFDRFLPSTTVGEGELYLGNTPGFSVTRVVNTVERKVSYGGRNYVSDSLPIDEEFSAQITTDNMSFENIALWFGGEIDYSEQRGLGFISEVFRVRHDRYYQLGKSVNTFGLRYVESVRVEKLVDEVFEPIPLRSNVLVNRTDGRFSLVDSSPDIQNGDVIRVHFQNRSTTTRGLIKRSDEVIGSLRFVAANPVGLNKDCFFPSVRLVPSGELPFKGDQWQQFSWDVGIRKLNPRTEYLYIMERGEGVYTRDERGIVDHSGIFIEDFPYWENVLDETINSTMAERGY